MTALRSRRTRHTVLGGVLTTMLTIAALVLAIVGVLTLRDSEEGETVGVDDRPVVTFPETPNLAIAVTDGDGRLASLVVATLLPEGRGGSIVTVPVNADANIGLGEARQPIASVFASDDPAGFASIVESLLSITIERIEVAGPDRLAEIVEPLVPIDVVLPEDIVESDSIGTGIVVEAGERNLRGSLVVEALTAIDDSGLAYDHHINDVELWSALAANAPVESGAAPTTDGDPQDAPATTDEFLERLFAGPVQVRDLDIDPGLAALAENASDVDMVVLDRRDVLLVFAQVSPSLVSTPNEGLSFRLEVRYSDQQLADVGGQFASRSQVSRTLTGELLFFQANVVSVDPTPLEGGAPEVTRIEVAEERFVEDLVEFAPVIFGEADVVVASTVLDGADVVVKLGTGYLGGGPDRSGGTVEDE